MGKAPTNRSIVADYCRRFPNTPTLTLAKLIYREHNERFTRVETVRTHIRMVRGASGGYQRIAAENRVPREKGKAGWAAECPPSAAEEWKPVEIEGPAKVLILSDIHVPYHAKEALEAAVAYGKKIKPDVVLLNGDYQDFYRISRFQQDPKKRLLKEEIDAGKEGLSWLRGRFPEARFIYKLGNHDERWDHWVWNKCVEFWEIENLQLHNVLDFERFGIERVGDNAVMCGKLPVFHGHEIGKGIFSPVNPARGAFLRTNHTVLIGHLHRASSHAEPDLFHSETMAWSTGCLCNRRPEYARVNKWSWGFAHVEIAKDGQFDVHNHRISNDYKVRTA